MRSPAPTGSAAPGRPCTPVPPFVPLSPVLPRQASGWHPLRRGGGVAPTLHLRWIILGATPTPALSVFLRFCWQFGSQSREPSQPSFRHDPSFPLVRKCLGGLRTGISFRVLLSSQCASPHSRSARPSSSCRPSGLRKRQRTFPNGASSKSHISSEPTPRTAPRPASTPCSFLTPRSSPPCRFRALGVKCCPRRSRRFRTRSSFVQLGRSCGIA